MTKHNGPGCCGCGGGGSPGTVDVLTCGCQETPTTLHLVCNYPGTMYAGPDDTLIYYPTAALSPVVLGQAWVGQTNQPSSYAPGMTANYVLFCINGVYTLAYGVTGGYANAGAPGGRSFAEDGAYGSYSIGSDGNPNTCTPFLLTIASTVYQEPANVFTIGG